jgi:hypothetical protein
VQSPSKENPQEESCGIKFLILLGVFFFKLLEKQFVGASNIFWPFGKLNGFGNKFLGILRDALTNRAYIFRLLMLS